MNITEASSQKSDKPAEGRSVELEKYVWTLQLWIWWNIKFVPMFQEVFHLEQITSC